MKPEPDGPNPDRAGPHPLGRASAAAGMALWAVVWTMVWRGASPPAQLAAMAWTLMALLLPRVYLLTLALALPLFGNNPGGPRHLYLLDLSLMGFVARDLIVRVAGLRSVRPAPLNGWVRLLVAGSAMTLIPQYKSIYCEAAVYRADFFFRIYNHYANAPVFGLRVWLDLALAASMFAALRDRPLTGPWRRALWGALLLGVTLSAAAGALDWLGVLSLEPWRGVNPDLAAFEFRRLQSTFWHSGWFAEYAALLAPAWGAAAWAAHRRGWRAARNLALAAAAFLALVQLLTFQRGGWLALAGGYGGIGLFLLLTAGKERRGRALGGALAMLGAAAVAALALASVVPALGERLAAIARIEDRARIWSSALDLARAHPWSGVGLGNYASAHGWAFPAGHANFVLDKMTAHSLYLHVYAERGVLLLAIVLVIGGLGLTGAWRAARDPEASPGRQAEGLALLGGLCALGVYGLFQYVFHVRAIELLCWMLLGLVAMRTPATPPPRSLHRRRLHRALWVGATILLIGVLWRHERIYFTPFGLYSPTDGRNYLPGGEVVELDLPPGADRVRVPLFCFDPGARRYPVVFTVELEGRRLARVVFRRAWSTDLELDLPPGRDPAAPLVVRASRTWSPYGYGMIRIPVYESGVNYLPVESIP